jgi:DNA-binding response OmpR family regulator
LHSAKRVSEPALIVLAEDSAELRELLSAGLERVGYQVVQAVNGADLVEKTRFVASRVSLIITDVRMPHMDGIAAVRALRAAGTTAPVIFITAFGDDRTRNEAESLGSSWINKPVGLRALRLAVGELLGAVPRDEAL